MSNVNLQITLQEHFKQLERLGLPVPQLEGDYEIEDDETDRSSVDRSAGPRSSLD
jgi:hypothetical protein